MQSIFNGAMDKLREATQSATEIKDTAKALGSSGVFKTLAAHMTGNEIGQKYDLEKSGHTATGGHRFMWRIFNAVHRKSKVPVSIFIFDKEDPALAAMSTTQRESLVASFRKDIAVLKQFSMAKPQPNPNVLRLYQVFEESKKMLAFCSERVVFSLGNALGHFDNLGPESLGQHNYYTLELLADQYISSLETSRGVAQVSGHTKKLSCCLCWKAQTTRVEILSTFRLA